MDETLRFNVIEHKEIPLNREVLVIPIKNENVDFSNTLYLENVSLEIWNLIKEGLSLADISDIIVRSYLEDDNVILEDIQQFVANLLNEGFISVISE